MIKKTIKKSIIVLSVLLLIFSPLSTIAAKRSIPIQDEIGLEVILIAEIPSKLVSEAFSISLTLDFTDKPDNVVRLIDIEIRVRLVDTLNQELTRKIVVFNALYVNTDQTKTTTVPYDSIWGSVGLELKVLLTVTRSGSLSSLDLTTDWLGFFVLKTGSFVTNYWWIFLIVGVAIIAGGALTLKFTVLRK